MSAAATLRGAVRGRLAAALAGTVNRVLDGAAHGASEPFVQLREAVATDWGTKDRTGREVRLGVSVRDAGDTATRCHAIAAAAEAAIEAMPRDLPGWRVVSIALIRSAVTGEGAGRSVALVDYRFRMLAS